MVVRFERKRLQSQTRNLVRYHVEQMKKSSGRGQLGSVLLLRRRFEVLQFTSTRQSPGIVVLYGEASMIDDGAHTRKKFSSPTSRQADKIDEKGWFASIGGSVSPMTLCGPTCASTEVRPQGTKIRLINVVFLRTLSEIKLKRTDTTLDLSQKAKRAGKEKKKKSKERRAARGIYPVGMGPVRR
ncbi:hypothetical protein BO99DRAFT_250609 [Aspergillus violaceofuscus CBS 115571]|uniref:Uncharacterized protein n=1 Tax=Aspergillus violaceofuscus (strain CBS 115571) TaxID=1450538 RepID=A0A2V5H169_ASPV1|nr:hypothetical protein BO99DRAFT_250609 [Aspergillus violaceofuscus CBS 115571]